MISRDEILKGRDKEYPLTPEMEANLDRLLIAVNLVRAAWGKPLIVTSGYRPGHYNKSARGALKSAHLTCEAVDFHDPDGSFGKWCLDNLKLLEEAGLYMESPLYTHEPPNRRWTHLQIRPTKNRVFIP